MYPQQVIDVVEPIVEELRVYAQIETEELSMLRDYLLEYVFEQFINGEDYEELSIMDVKRVLAKTLSETILDSMINDGLIEILDDEIQLTEKGKLLAITYEFGNNLNLN
jgi:predicted methyltransferase